MDILANNVGRNSTVPALDVDLDEVRSTFEVNVFAIMRMYQEFALLLIEVNSLLQGCVLPKAKAYVHTLELPPHNFNSFLILSLLNY